MNLAAAFLELSALASGEFDGAPFYSGQIVTHAGAAYDAGGSIVTPGAVVLRDCQVQIDSATEAMRQGAGFADGDVRFIVLAASFTGGLNTDATIAIADGARAGNWQVSGLERDPAGIGYVGRGRRA